jgi:Cu(I)/Ag(I) efflux system protein CusF
MKRPCPITPLAAALFALAVPAIHASQPADDALTEAEVRKVDKGAGKITLRHGAIRSLDMPPMTMVFQAADPALLDKVKAGDKVRFAARQEAGAYVVIALEPAP